MPSADHAHDFKAFDSSLGECNGGTQAAARSSDKRDFAPNGAGVGDVVAFLLPYIADMSKWPLAKDVEYFDDLPARRPSLLFAVEAPRRPAYLAFWRRLDPDPTVPEIIDNMPIRQTLLWVDPMLYR